MRSRLMLRFSLTLLVVALVSALVPAAPVVAGSGRSFSRCIDACNTWRAYCYDRCDTDCTALYANDPALLSTCQTTCYAVCTDFSQECKQLCRELRDPIPSEP